MSKINSKNNKKIIKFYEFLKLGLEFIKDKQFEKSVYYFQSAVSFAEKKNIDAHINLINVYIVLKNIDEALKISLLAYKINSTDSTISKLYLYLLKRKGDQLIEKNSLIIAYEYFEKAIQINEQDIESYKKLFFCLERTFKLDLYEKYLIKAKKNFQSPVLNLYEVHFFIRKKEYQKANKILKQIIKPSTTLASDELVFYYDLMFKCLEKLGNFEKAYSSISKRNLLKSQQPENINFDKNIILSVIKSYQDYFTFNNSKQFKKNSLFKNYINPTFLVGFPRSGTTLLDSILRSHSQINVLEEKPFLSIIRDEFFQINKNKLESIEGLKDNQIIILQNKYNQLIENDYGKNSFTNKIVIDKFPLNIMEMGFIKKIFPNAKFIVVLRHPCDVIVSCFTTNFKINEGMANFYTLGDAANLYSKVFDLYCQYKKIFADDIYEIKYEKIINNFDITINSLLEFLDVKWEDNLKAFNSTAKSRSVNTPSYSQVVEPLYNSSINRWKNYKDIEKVYPLVEKWIKEFNY